MSDSTVSLRPLYPLRFAPIYKDYLWGGNRLESLFGRPLAGAQIAESWEIADHEHGESVVMNGPLRGVSLHELVRTRPKELFGRSRYPTDDPHARFPVMLKYLDAKRTLSIQVHPSTEDARRLSLPDSGKTEAWIVVDAVPWSEYYVGFKEAYDRSTIENALARGTLADLLNPIEARVGDCILIEAGTPHALGDGVMVAEVQATSDMTFRLFDWNRLDGSGKPRPLAVKEALESLDFERGPVKPRHPRLGPKEYCETLIEHEQFVLERWTTSTQFNWNADGRCRLWTVLSGMATAIFTAGRRTMAIEASGRASDSNAIEELHCGDSILVPAVTRSIRWVSEGETPLVLLSAKLP